MSDKPFDDHPALGAFIASYPANRTRLLLRGGLFYAAVVLFLQLFFIELDDTLASIILIGGFALAAWAAAWYVLHLWNREVILYEKGFTYTEGSRHASIPYASVVRVALNAEQLSIAGLIRRNVYHYKMTTDQDEVLTINNLYANVAELGLRLERAIAHARKPLVEHQIAGGQRLDFGPEIALSAEGIHHDGHDGRTLPWAQFGGYRTASGQIIIQARDEDDWAAIKLKHVDNAVLLVDLLRARQPTVA